jgi:hypothetical protein
LARQREETPVRGAFDVRHGFHEAPHHVAVATGEQRHRETAAGGDEARGDRRLFEGDANELGLQTDLDDEVGGHEVDVVAVPTPDEVQPGGECP